VFNIYIKIVKKLTFNEYYYSRKKKRINTRYYTKKAFTKKILVSAIFFFNLYSNILCFELIFKFRDN
jgi:hypothetical protein